MSTKFYSAWVPESPEEATEKWQLSDPQKIITDGLIPY